PPLSTLLPYTTLFRSRNDTWHSAPMPRVLITGITGFAGSHLAEHLVASGHEIHGLAHEDPPFPNLAAIRGRVSIHAGDITRLERSEEHTSELQSRGHL